MTFIYALCDPRNGQIRYIGKANNIGQRYATHLREKSKCHRSVWIQSLLAMGIKPELTIIENVEADATWQDRERFWIKHYRSLGYDLTNYTDGGEGGDTGNGLPERRRAVSESLKGRVFTEEHRKKLSESNRRRVISEASRQKMSVARKGHKLSEDHCRKLSMARMGRKLSPYQRECLLKSSLGRVMSEEQRKKLSEAFKKRTPEQMTRLSAAVAASNRRRAELRRGSVI
jgi:hypothetical protein